MVPEPIEVYWSDFSLLKADLMVSVRFSRCLRIFKSCLCYQCLDMLLRLNQDWKWFINLSGSSLPLLNVYELEHQIWVKLSYSIHGNSIITKKFPAKYKERIKFKHLSPKGKTNSDENPVMYKRIPKRTLSLQPNPPHDLVIFKGFKEVVLYRSFAKWCLDSDIGKDFLHWCSSVTYPEEIFFSTLTRINYQQHMDNGITHQDLKSPSSYYQNDLCVRRSLWEENVKICHGKMKRYICNLAIDDFPEALLKDEEGGSSNCLFLNKFDLGLKKSSQAVSCLYFHLFESAVKYVFDKSLTDSPEKCEETKSSINEISRELQNQFNINEEIFAERTCPALSPKDDEHYDLLQL